MATGQWDYSANFIVKSPLLPNDWGRNTHAVKQSPFNYIPKDDLVPWNTPKSAF